MDLSKYPTQWIELSKIDFSDRRFQFCASIENEEVTESLKTEGQKIAIILIQGRLNGHPEPFDCHSEGAERSKNLTQGKLREESHPNTDPSPKAQDDNHSGHPERSEGSHPYQIISGFSRINAIKNLGWEKVLAIVIPKDAISDEEALRLNFIENIERKSLNDFDLINACNPDFFVNPLPKDF